MRLETRDALRWLVVDYSTARRIGSEPAARWLARALKWRMPKCRAIVDEALGDRDEPALRDIDEDAVAEALARRVRPPQWEKP